MKKLILHIAFLLGTVQAVFCQPATKEDLTFQQLFNKDAEFSWILNADTLLVPHTLIKERILFRGNDKVAVFTYWSADTVTIKKSKNATDDFTEKLSRTFYEPNSYYTAFKADTSCIIGLGDFKIKLDQQTRQVSVLQHLKSGKRYQYVEKGMRVGNEN